MRKEGVMAEKTIKDLVFDCITTRMKVLYEDTSYSRATLARLRRGVGKKIEEFPDAWDIMLCDLDERLLSKNGSASFAEKAIFTTFTLYALHQQGKFPEKMNSGNDSFGAAVGKLVIPNRNEEAIKRRFDAVITSKDYTELSWHAKGLIQLLKANSVPMNYAKFATDLYIFQQQEQKNKVRLRWGEDFYRASRSNTNEKKEDTENE
jgi:CRISPR system Cascade subunit CasB